MDKLTLLRSGRALIADPKNWVKGVYCVNDDGCDCEPDVATAFCSVGALWGAQADATDSQILEAQKALDTQVPLRGVNDQGKRIPSMGILNYNDRVRTKHKDVLRVWDDAIALAEEERAGAPLPPVVEEAPVETIERKELVHV